MGQGFRADGATLVGRSQFVKGALVAGGAAVVGAVVAGATDATGAADDDAKALDLLLLVESTEVAFYERAIEDGALQGELREYAEAVVGQEKQHVAALKEALGRGPRGELSFEFGDATRDADSFARTAAELEDLAVAAYNGQATNVSAGALAAAATIVSVEARHAAWIRSIVGQPPAPDATDTPRSAEQVLSGLERIGLRR